VIRILDTEGGIIEFSSKSSALKNPVKTITRELIYGYKCPYCSNVIQALFYTEDMIDLSPYEQTNVLHIEGKNIGTTMKTIPNDKDTQSGYKTEFFACNRGNGQLIVLKNHVVNWTKAADKWQEVGERCCTHIGVRSLLDSHTLMDLIYAMGLSSLAYTPIPPPPISFLKTVDYGYAGYQIDYLVLPPIGKSVNMVLVPRSYIMNNEKYYGTTRVCSQWGAISNEDKLAWARGEKP
jgi:hypothetical protein